MITSATPNPTRAEWGKWTTGPEIELNDDFTRALSLLERPKGNVFVTGKAGTGKSTLLQHFRKATAKNVAVLAPTGVAAVNVGGQTIHSFFGFKPNVTEDNVRRAWADRQRLIRSLDSLVIDEASMVRADLLDCVDKSLRLNRANPSPFGGVQMLFFGDLHQLPPVVTDDERDALDASYDSPFFFHSRAFRESSFQVVELDKVYRQKDASFIELLNAVRSNSASPRDIAALNSRVASQASGEGGELCVTLTATNDVADAINETALGSIDRPARRFEATWQGDFDKNRHPAPLSLRLKAGSQVMLLNNDSAGRWVNGSVGSVLGFSNDADGGEVVCVRLPTGDVEVGRFKWSLFEYSHDVAKNKLVTREVGSFSQYPLRLAWAVTVHKSQGQTFDRVHIDAGRGMFAPGQLYVALSRCRTLNGITLARPIDSSQILTDARVTEFLAKPNAQSVTKTLGNW